MVLYTMYMSYKGKYKPEHPKKYKGDPTNIIYRSLWERKFMRYCDLNESVYQWQSEEIIIPYKSPMDNRIHRYFPDFFIKYTDRNGKRRSVVIEVKPKRQLKMPEKNPKRRTKSWAYDVNNWIINQAKWKAAEEYCADRQYEFRIMTEDDLGV
ncbi:MAG: head completion protein [Cryomorphaceae bacterium]|nr:head completion protein [Cryomorphaceae bacterium]